MLHVPASSRIETITMLAEKVKREEIKNILIIRDDHLGDLICSLPTVMAVRRHFPESKLTILVSEPCVEIVKNHPGVDHVLVRKKKKSGRFRNIENLWERIKLLSSIRQRKFDLLIALRCRFCARHALVAMFSGARHRLGHKSPKRRHFILNWAFNLWPRNFSSEKHEIERTHDIVKEIGIPLKEVCFDIQISEENERFVSKFLEARNILPERPIICYHASASKPKKQWSLPKMASLVNLVHNRYPEIANVITYDPENREHGVFLEQISNRNIVPFMSKRFMQLAALYARSKIVVSLDGAPMHLSAALGIPTIGIFATHETFYWAPWGEKNVSIPGESHLVNLSPEEVFEKLDYMIRLHIFSTSKY